ncbi:MAG: CHASE domain-containing protein, partial [Pyrinomonadaceae bacterium]
MKLKSKSTQDQQGRNFVPYVVLMAGLLFTSVVCYYLSAIGEAEDEARFRGSVQGINSAIESRIETYEALLRATAGLYAASDLVTHQDFKNFVGRLEVRQHYPGIQGIGFSIRLTPGQKDALIASMRREGDANFKIWPEGERDEYHSIIYLEPPDRRNQVAIGYDMFSEPVRRAAMEQARDSGQATASRAVTLVQEIDGDQRQTGFLVYVPVYRNGSDVSSVAARREALAGFVYSPFRADDFLGQILPAKRYDDVTFQVYDGPQTESASLLHDSSSISGPLPTGYRPRFIATTKVKIAGQSWSLNFASHPAFDLASGNNFVPHALAGGLLISLLFFGVTQSQMRARGEAEKAAAGLRESEATVRKTLADRERAEEALRESEERYRELVEDANDIVYTLDLNGKMTSVN